MQWTTLDSSLPIPRVYHSTAVLLPDGRVLSMGGNGDPQKNSEIYSPPYLFKGTRPTITSAPTSVVYGQSFFVQTPDAAAISKVTMLRLSSVTHSFNMSQYINTLSFSQATGASTLWLPTEPLLLRLLPLLRLPDPTCSSSSTEAEYRRSQKSSKSAVAQRRPRWSR